MKAKQAIRISNHKFKLSKFNTVYSDKSTEENNDLKERLENDIEQISSLQNKLFAENRQSLLIIFQGMDSAGKDGTIKHIMKGVNPQGVEVISFKHPSIQELEHDYLWRHNIKLPKSGQIVIFNRSHYENVLISKVHPELVLAERLHGYDKLSSIDKVFWKLRYNQINYFERRNIETGTQILKFFLHLSKDEQCKRFLDRINNQDKHWKFSSADIEERKYWVAYQQAYEQAIKHTSTKQAPWHIIPADDKLYARMLIGRIILEKLQEMKPVFPPKTKAEQEYMLKARASLEKEISH
ncbi:MAG: polyphosphate kinase 2 family protein [Bacteroidetes bacterium]|nr:MAG: polyphosphate kinase 2 family protein [Bacteroidota bacterium]